MNIHSQVSHRAALAVSWRGGSKSCPQELVEVSRRFLLQQIICTRDIIT